MTTKIILTQGDLDVKTFENDPIVTGVYYPPDKGFRWNGTYIRAGHAGYILIRCPHCGRDHVHGWNPGEDRPIHRVSHCGTIFAGYFIQEVER